MDEVFGEVLKEDSGGFAEGRIWDANEGSCGTCIHASMNGVRREDLEHALPACGVMKFCFPSWQMIFW